MFSAAYGKTPVALPMWCLEHNMYVCQYECHVKIRAERNALEKFRIDTQNNRLAIKEKKAEAEKMVIIDPLLSNLLL